MNLITKYWCSEYLKQWLLKLSHCCSYFVSVNLALNKKTEQSSIWNGYPSSRPVDGQYKTPCNIDFTHTDFEEYAWWQVDLGKMSEIKKIQIYYRQCSFTFVAFLRWYYIIINDFILKLVCNFNFYPLK